MYIPWIKLNTNCIFLLDTIDHFLFSLVSILGVISYLAMILVDAPGVNPAQAPWYPTAWYSTVHTEAVEAVGK